MYVPMLSPASPAGRARRAVKSATWSAGCMVWQMLQSADRARDVPSAARSTTPVGRPSRSVTM